MERHWWNKVHTSRIRHKEVYWLIFVDPCEAECVCSRENFASSGNVLMHFFKGEENSDLSLSDSLSLISPPLLYSSIQMGTAWDERISLYWTWLNAVLMKAHADNSFFIMSLARLGISFSIAERTCDFHFCCFGWVRCLLTGVRLCVCENIIFYIAFLLD